MTRTIAAALAARDQQRAMNAAADRRTAELRAEAAAQAATAEREDEADLAAEGAALAASGAVDDRRSAAAQKGVRQRRRRAKALGIAADALVAERPARMQALAEADLAVADATLTAFRFDRDAAAAEVRDVFTAAIAPLARLLAADAVRHGLVGDRYSFDTTRHQPAELWAAGPAVGKLLDALVPRLAPDGFRAAVETEAKRIAAAVLAAFAEEAKR